MVFLTAGLGGGTGTGAMPVIAKLCQELGLLTVAVVSLPFRFEGEPRMKNALRGLAELEAHVDALVVIQNNNILKVASKNMPQKEAFLLADQVLYRAVRGIAEIITKPGYVNVDFADVRTIMQDGGYSLLGMSTQRGENRALMAVEEALSSPLLDNIDIRGARGLLVNITASEDSLTIQETEQIMERIQEALGDSETNIIMGQVFDEQMGNELSLTLIATGLTRPESLVMSSVASKPAKSPSPKASTPPPPPVASELRLDAPTPPPAVPPSPAPRPNILEKIRQVEQDAHALARARTESVLYRTGINPPPPLSSARIEPISDDRHNVIRRNNPHLYDNAD